MTDYEQIVVLGWDALDLELAERYGVADSFGAHQTKIKTYVNEHVGEPHTMELWPSMILGQPPSEHGIRAATPGDGIDWDNPLLDTASSLANGIVPQPVLTEIGARLRGRGAGLGQKTAIEYREEGREVVFDARDRPISIPNYETEWDRRYGLDAARDELWAALEVDRSVSEGIEPQVDINRVQSILSQAYGRRVGLTLSALQAGRPLVWTWFGYLDSVGHMAPAVECSLQPVAYRVAASITELIRETAPPETAFVSISDHGLQDGSHTEYATLAADDSGIVERVTAVDELAAWIRDVDADGRAVGGDATQSHGEMTEQLEALGYI
jgi:hypothetical protein